MRSAGIDRPRVTFARNGRISSGRVGPPKAIRRTASARAVTPSPARQLVDGVDERADVFDRRLGQDPVPEIEDVARPARGLAEDRGRLRADLGDGCEEDERVEVSLDGDVVADACPR